MQEFIEGAVKLGEAGETALEGNIRDGGICGKQECLGISDPRHLDIVGQRKAGDLLKLMGQVVAADKEFPGD